MAKITRFVTLLLQKYSIVISITGIQKSKKDIAK